jgi:hypothetical protein
MALLWFEQLCPPDKIGRRRPGKQERWIPLLDNPRRYYRHFLLGPYLIFRAHEKQREILEPILCNPPNVATGEVFRTIVETQQFVTSVPIIALIGRLYYDPRAGRMKRGAGTKTAGGVRRLGDLLSQLDLTYDLHSIKPDDLMHLLPKEFLEIGRRTNGGQLEKAS